MEEINLPFNGRWSGAEEQERHPMRNQQKTVHQNPHKTHLVNYNNYRYNNYRHRFNIGPFNNYGNFDQYAGNGRESNYYNNGKTTRNINMPAANFRNSHWNRQIR